MEIMNGKMSKFIHLKIFFIILECTVKYLDNIILINFLINYLVETSKDRHQVDWVVVPSERIIL